MAADFVRLAGLLRQRIEMNRKNVTESRPAIQDEDPRVISRLYALNGYDLQLWAWWERESDRLERQRIDDRAHFDVVGTRPRRSRTMAVKGRSVER